MPGPGGPGGGRGPGGPGGGFGGGPRGGGMGPRGGMMPPPRRRPMRRGCGGSCCMPYVMSVVGAISALTLGTVGVRSAGKKKQ
ncbi:MAG: hypothetical protein LUH56_04380 [Oscillospiraceae bacterium]|nr:hypothetical protein [Oscillospiraceae bacterium]